MKKVCGYFLVLLACMSLSACAKTKAATGSTKFDTAMKTLQENAKVYADYGHIKDDVALGKAFDVLEAEKLSDEQQKDFDKVVGKLPADYQNLAKTYQVKLDGQTVKAKYLKLATTDNETYQLSVMTDSPAIKSLNFKVWTTISGQDDLATYPASYNKSKKVWEATFVLRAKHWDGTTVMMQAEATGTSGNSVQLAENQAEVIYGSMTQLVDHRGNVNAGPENSIAAFANSRYWGIETDITLTKDHQWVVMHDATIDRMTGGKGKVSDYTLAELRKNYLKSSTITDKTELVIPTFAEYLKICRDKKVTPVIEIKTDQATQKDFDGMISAVATLDMSKKMVCISFHPEMLKLMRNSFPTTELLLLTNDLSDKNLQLVKDMDAGVDVNYTAVQSAEQVKKLHDEGINVGVWTVPKDKWALMRSYDVDFITTDD